MDIKTKEKMDKITSLACLCCSYTADDLERDIRSLKLDDALNALTNLHDRKIYREGIKKEGDDHDASRIFSALVKDFIAEKLTTATTIDDRIAIYASTYAAFPSHTLHTVAVLKSVVTDLFQYRAETSAPVGRKLFDEITEDYSWQWKVDHPNSDVYTLIGIAAKSGILPDYETVIEDVVTKDCERMPARTCKMFYERAEKCLAEIESAQELYSKGFTVTEGKYGGKRLHYDGKLLAVENSIIADPKNDRYHGKARWITEEIIDRDVTGEQRMITLFEYKAGEGVKQVYEEHAWEREGELISPTELFKRFE